MLEQLNATLTGRYVVERELGRGGMATVWLAQDLRHNRTVALKVLDPELAGAIGADRFVREVQLTARLQHPNVVPILDSGVITVTGGPSLPWYTMACIPGESLRALLARERQLPVEDAVRIAETVAGALHAAHSAGIIHRDVKPENILLADGHVYVVDFGIAKAIADTGNERLTSTGLAIGTPAYMSPEQAAAGGVDARTDQYSLGCVLYEMLAGEPPFTGPTAQAVVARRFAEAARPIRPVRPGVPVAVERATLKALERVPADRFPNLAAFAAALRSEGTVREMRPAKAGRGGVRVAVAALVVGAIAFAAWQAFGRGKTAPTQVRDPELVAVYKRGIDAYDRRTPAGTVDAVNALRVALTRDSTYVAAWVGLAKTYVRAYQRSFEVPGVPRDSVLQLAIVAVDRALALDPDYADAWTTRSLLARQVNPTDVESILRSARRAVVLDSTSAPAWHAFAVGLAESGDLEAALVAWRRCVALDPAYTQGLAFLALGHFWHRDLDSAAKWVDSAIAVDPNFLLAQTTAGFLAAERRDFVPAAAAFEAARRLSTGVEVVNARAGIALVEAMAGRQSAARRILRQADSGAQHYTPTPLHTAVDVAQAYAALAEPAHALDWLNRYSPAQDVHFQLHLRCDPSFDPLRDDPQFRALLTMQPRNGRC